MKPCKLWTCHPTSQNGRQFLGTADRNENQISCELYRQRTNNARKYVYVHIATQYTYSYIYTVLLYIYIYIGNDASSMIGWINQTKKCSTLLKKFSLQKHCIACVLPLQFKISLDLHVYNNNGEGLTDSSDN